MLAVEAVSQRNTMPHTEECPKYGHSSYLDILRYKAYDINRILYAEMYGMRAEAIRDYRSI